MLEEQSPMSKKLGSSTLVKCTGIKITMLVYTGLVTSFVNNKTKDTYKVKIREIIPNWIVSFE